MLNFHAAIFYKRFKFLIYKIYSDTVKHPFWCYFNFVRRIKVVNRNEDLRRLCLYYDSGLLCLCKC